MPPSKIFIPLKNIYGLRTLIKKGWNNTQIAEYYCENGIKVDRMTISRRVQELKESEK